MSGIGFSIVCGTLKNQIQISTATEYATREVQPHNNLNLVPKSENLVVVSSIIVAYSPNPVAMPNGYCRQRRPTTGTRVTNPTKTSTCTNRTAISPMTI